MPTRRPRDPTARPPTADKEEEEELSMVKALLVARTLRQALLVSVLLLLDAAVTEAAAPAAGRGTCCGEHGHDHDRLHRRFRGPRAGPVRRVGEVLRRRGRAALEELRPGLHEGGSVRQLLRQRHLQRFLHHANVRTHPLPRAALAARLPADPR